MRRARAALLTVLVAGAWTIGTAAVSSAAAADTDLRIVSTDTSKYPQVQVVVASPAALSEQAVPASAFRVAEDGEARTAQVAPVPTDQVQVALVVDTSGSMKGAPLRAAKDAAGSFLASLPPSVPVAVVGFGAGPAVVSPLSIDRQAHLDALAGLTATGETALYDAVGLGARQLPVGAGTRRFVVVLSDGADTSSTASLDRAAAELTSTKTSLFAVDLQTPDSDPGALSRLASATGGKVVEAGDPQALVAAFKDVAASIARQYVVTYTSRSHGRAGLEIVVDAGDVKAAAHETVDLPPAPAAGDGGGGGVATWALVAGAALVAVAIFVIGLTFALSWVPRARGIRRRGIGLSGVAEQAGRLGDTALERGGASEPVAGALEKAGLELRPGEFLVIAAAGTVVAFAVGWLALSVWVGLGLAVVAVAGSRVVLDQLAAARRRKFASQLGGALQLLAGSLRAGHGLAQALDTVATESESPAADEFRRVTVETRLGRDLGDALWAMAARVESEDFEWVVQAIDIQRDVGGDLAEILDQVAATVRERERLRRQVHVLSAEGRISAWVLMILPFALAAFMSVTNRDYIATLFESTTGLLMLAAGGVLLAAGGVWLRRIVKPIF